MGRQSNYTDNNRPRQRISEDQAAAAASQDGATIVSSTDAQQRLREEGLLRLAAIVDSSDDAIIGKTLDGTIVSWNPGAERIYGYTAEEVIGKPISILLPPERPNELPRIMERLRQGKRIDHFETVRVRKNGQYIDVSVTISPIKDASGTIIGASTIARDITERKRITEAQRFLAEVNTTLAASLDYQTTLMAVVRLVVPQVADNCIVDIVEGQTLQQVAVAHIDPQKEQLLREMRLRYPPDLNDPHPLSDVIRTGEPQLLADVPDAALMAVARDEQHREMLWQLRPSSYMAVPLVARGRTLGVVSFARNKTGWRYGLADLALAQQVASRAALAVDNARLYQEAQDAIKLRDHFLSIASHELKTPLTSLLGHAQAIERRAQRDGTLGARDLRAVKVIVEQASRLNKMIAAMLDISRIETGQLTIERAPVDLCALAWRVVEEIQPTLTAHTVECRTPSQPLIVEGDELRLEQVLQNLLQNAIKYSPDGGPIVIDVGRRGSTICVSVTDQGIGIAQETLSQLFQRFYRAPEADIRHISGMGVGLYVVKELVTQHGGTVEVSSQEQRGSTFTVCLPERAGT